MVSLLNSIKCRTISLNLLINYSNKYNLSKQLNHSNKSEDKLLVNGLNISYERVGTGNHILLLMSGAFGSGRIDFSKQMKGLNRDKFTLIAWDPPGYGYSRPPERDFKDFYWKDATIATQFMKTLGFHKYSIIGWSDGGITAMIMASKDTNTIQKLVVFNTKAFISDKDIKNRKFISHLKNWSPKQQKTFIDLYGEEVITKMLQDYFNEYQKLDRDLCKHEVKKITQKCLILHADDDPLVPREHSLYLHDNIKNSMLFSFSKGSHNIHQNNVQEFNKIVEDFLLK